MSCRRSVRVLAAIAIVLAYAESVFTLDAQHGARPAVPIGLNGMRGVVIGPVGPEAGVW